MPSTERALNVLAFAVDGVRTLTANSRSNDCENEAMVLSQSSVAFVFLKSMKDMNLHPSLLRGMARVVSSVLSENQRVKMPRDVVDGSGSGSSTLNLGQDVESSKDD
jgi:hypothetical protein